MGFETHPPYHSLQALCLVYLLFDSPGPANPLRPALSTDQCSAPAGAARPVIPHNR